MTTQAEATLESLSELISTVDRAGLEFWIAGGWAVDFHAGRVTRPHEDIDLVVAHGDREKLHANLLKAGFEVFDDREPDSEMIYRRDGLKVDVSFIVELSDGKVVSPGWEHWPWSADSFSPGSLRLDRVVCRVVSASTLLTSKRDYQTNVGDEPRPRDVADIRILEELSAARE